MGQKQNVKNRDKTSYFVYFSLEDKRALSFEITVPIEWGLCHIKPASIMLSCAEITELETG